MAEEKKTKPRKDRIRAKKKTYKLTKRHVTAKWFQEQTHYIYKVSPSMVHHIFSGRRHAQKEDAVSIYDLIAEDMTEG
jgi:hypothetical protein